MSAPITILLIEDDAGHARLIEKNIRRAGISNVVRNFSDGSTALAFLESPQFVTEGPFLVLLDLNLPDMSGVDILTVVKSNDRTRKTPVIILTTTDDRAEIQRCYDLGCNIYITKPVEYESFSNAIRQLGMFLTIIQV